MKVPLAARRRRKPAGHPHWSTDTAPVTPCVFPEKGHVVQTLAEAPFPSSGLNVSAGQAWHEPPSAPNHPGPHKHPVADVTAVALLVVEEGPHGKHSAETAPIPDPRLEGVDGTRLARQNTRHRVDRSGVARCTQALPGGGGASDRGGSVGRTCETRRSTAIPDGGLVRVGGARLARAGCGDTKVARLALAAVDAGLRRQAVGGGVDPARHTPHGGVEVGGGRLVRVHRAGGARRVTAAGVPRCAHALCAGAQRGRAIRRADCRGTREAGGVGGRCRWPSCRC